MKTRKTGSCSSLRDPTQTSLGFFFFFTPVLLLHHGREMLGNKTSGSALKGSPPEPTSNKVWLFQNSGKFQKDLADDQSILEETLILPVFFFF